MLAEIPVDQLANRKVVRRGDSTQYTVLSAGKLFGETVLVRLENVDTGSKQRITHEELCRRYHLQEKSGN